jgi:hypothetical protein
MAKMTHATYLKMFCFVIIIQFPPTKIRFGLKSKNIRIDLDIPGVGIHE